MISKYIQEHKDEILEDLISLVSVQASTADIQELGDVRNKLKEIIKKRLNVESEEIVTQSTRNVLYTPLSFDKNPILLVGHYDTVHPINKIEIKQEDNILYGPGVLDMKAGLVQAIWACKALKDLNLEMPPIHLLFNGDEEIGSRDSKGIILEKAKDAKLALLLEPGVENGDLKTGRKGGMSCIIKIYGKAAHAGNHPEDGINANLEMAHHIIALQNLNNFEIGTTVNVGIVSGGTASNVVCDEAMCKVDLRYKILKEKERIKQAVLDIPLVLEGTSKTLEFSEGSNPMEQTSQNLELFEMAHECAHEFGFEIGHQFVGGGSDGNRMSCLGLPILDGLGAIGKGIHALDEQIHLDKYYQRISLLILLLTKLNK